MKRLSETINKNERILSIYTKLIDGDIINKSEEAIKYGVNERSIQRDLDDIRVFLDKYFVENGYINNVVYDRKENGYKLAKINHMKLTNGEVLAICKILLDSRAFTKQEIVQIIDKLLNCCVPKVNFKMVDELIADEKFHYVEPQHKSKFIDKMWSIGVAIRENRTIKINYKKVSQNAQVKRIINPVAIMFSEYYFYLAAFIVNIDRKEEFEVEDDPYPTIYRIDRITKLQITDEHFRIPYKDRFEEGEFRKKIQFMYGGKLQKIKFKYKGESVEAVLDRLPTAKIISEDESGTIIYAEVFGKGIDMWLRSQGEMIEILQREEK